MSESTALTTRPVDIRGALVQAMPRIATLLGGDPEKAKRVVAIVRTEVAKNDYLAECDPYSVVQAVSDAVAIGLLPGSLLGEAYLVPFKGKAQCIPGYRGYVKLALRSDLVLKVEARLVYAGDKFEVDYGTTPVIRHKPELFSGVDRSDAAIQGAYAVAHLKSGDTQFVVMTRDEIEKRRASSRGADRGDSPWNKWYPEQCMKTAVRALAKLLPLSDDFRAAEELDNRYDTGGINSPLPHESVEEVQARVIQKTSDRVEDLKQRMGVQQATPQQPAEQQAPPQAKRRLQGVLQPDCDPLCNKSAHHPECKHFVSPTEPAGKGAAQKALPYPAPGIPKGTLLGAISTEDLYVLVEEKTSANYKGLREAMNEVLVERKKKADESAASFDEFPGALEDKDDDLPFENG